MEREITSQLTTRIATSNPPWLMLPLSQMSICSYNGDSPQVSNEWTRWETVGWVTFLETIGTLLLIPVNVANTCAAGQPQQPRATRFQREDIAICYFFQVPLGIVGFLANIWSILETSAQLASLNSNAPQVSRMHCWQSWRRAKIEHISRTMCNRPKELKIFLLQWQSASVLL